MRRHRSRTRLAVTSGLAAAAVLAFAAIGGTGLAAGLAKPAKAQYGPGQYQYNAKVTVCHKGKVTIRISVNALKAHQAHDDTLGTCAAARAAKAAKLGKSGKPEKAGKQQGKSSKPAKTGSTATPPENGNGHGNGKANGKNKG